VHGRFVVPPDDDGAHGTIRFDDLGDAEGEVHQRNVTVFGIAFRTGEHVFSIDPHDPLVPGFVLR
jgi:proline racemase